MKVPGEIDGLDSALIPASSIPRPTLERRKLDSYPALATRFFDPQLYLSRLDGNAARNHCVKLASYGWFAADGLPEFESGEGTQADWRSEMQASITDAWSGDYPKSAKAIRSAARSAIEFQVGLSVEEVILAAPLTTQSDTSLSREVEWLDAGIAALKSIDVGDRPSLATVAVSEDSVLHQSEWDSDLIDALLDQYGSRGVRGIYLIVERGSNSPRELTNTRTCGWILEFVWRAKKAGFERVVLNFCGTFGCIALCAGVDRWCSGWYRSLRRLSIGELEASSGLAFPTYFSNRLLSDIDLREDLDRVSEGGRIRDLVDGGTCAEQPLLAALEQGGKVDDAIGWQYSRSNVQLAQQQYFEVGASITSELLSVPEADRLDEAISRVSAARKTMCELFEAGLLTERSAGDHLPAWERALKGLRETLV